MKPCGCEFCNDLRNIEPAKYISGGDKKFQEWINKAKAEKKFVYNVREDLFIIVSSCPACGYEFTEEDYDSYD